MSFGFSVGDFLTAATLINNLITCLNSSFLSSTSSYQELVVELSILKKGLVRIEGLNGPTEAQQLQVQGIQLAALNCQSVLVDFLQKIEKYDESLGTASPQAGSSTDDGGTRHRKFGRPTLKKLGNLRRKLKDVERKIGWELRMTKEVQVLRSYLSAHVGSLNMRLSILDLYVIPADCFTIRQLVTRFSC